MGKDSHSVGTEKGFSVQHAAHYRLDARPRERGRGTRGHVGLPVSAARLAESDIVSCL